jgi:glycosyltransferase involved in cell wall biosynthesis
MLHGGLTDRESEIGDAMRQITVGIPVYNGMPYLPESVESILRQDYKDFEILIVNDGSTDGSAEYLHTLRDPRLRIVDQENRGLTATLNRMLSEAATPWLARHDADDVACPQRLDRAVDYIRRYPEAGMFYSLAEYYPAGSVGLFRTTRGSSKGIRDLVRSGRLPAICHSTVFLNVERAKALGGYRFNLHVEDIDFWWRIALHHDIRLIPEVLTRYRQNLQSICSTNLEEQTVSILYVQYLLLSHLEKREPLAYEEARIPLQQLFDPRKVIFRNHLRAFNIELGRGNKNRAIYQATRAFAASPGSFVRRLWDEYFPGTSIAMGEPPALFKKYDDILWPSDKREQVAGGHWISGSELEFASLNNPQKASVD